MVIKNCSSDSSPEHESVLGKLNIYCCICISGAGHAISCSPARWFATQYLRNFLCGAFCHFAGNAVMASSFASGPKSKWQVMSFPKLSILHNGLNRDPTVPTPEQLCIPSHPSQCIRFCDLVWSKRCRVSPKPAISLVWI